VFTDTKLPCFAAKWLQEHFQKYFAQFSVERIIPSRYISSLKSGIHSLPFLTVCSLAVAVDLL